MKKWFAGVVLLLFLTGEALAAAVPTSLSISQAVQNEGTLHLYLSVLDAGGMPIELPSGSELALSVGGTQRECTVQPVSESASGTGYVFAVDISGSLSDATFQKVQDALSLWVDNLGANDAAALLAFGDQVTVVSDFSGDRTALKQQIAALAPTDNTTQLYNGLIAAFGMASRQSGSLPERRVIIALTDGDDEAVAGATRTEVAAKAAECTLPLYVVGFESKLTEDRSALDALGEIARSSSGAYLAAGTDIPAAYQEVYQRIQKSYLVEAEISTEDATDSIQGISLALSSGDMTLRTGTDLRLNSFVAVEPAEALAESPAETQLESTLPLTPEPAPVPDNPVPLPAIAVVSALALVFAVVLIVYCVRSSKKQKEEADAQAQRDAKNQLDRALQNKRKVLVPGPGGTRAVQFPQGGGHTRPVRSPPVRTLQISITRNGCFRSQQSLALIGDIRVGREPKQNTLSVPEDDTISAQHFILRAGADGGLLLRDDSSTNGTWLIQGDGKVRVPQRQDYPLGDETRLQAGDTVFQITMNRVH
ncbi:MAG: VWA domain-containing protein [Oscillospiraceae bacterium]|nr:VWA domain-containing protein [Oscillospiraceae bacterium]